MNHPPAFNSQFVRKLADGTLVAAASCRLFTRPAGNSVGLLATYTNEDGSGPNANPIVLDANGRCRIFLNPAQAYLFELRTPAAEADALIWQEDDIAPSAKSTGVVSSVNGQTGAVTLDAADIPYTKSSAAAWLTATDVEAALDQIADRADAPPASSVTVADAGGLFTGTNVEDVLAELATSSLLPARTDRNGYVLALNGSGALEWQRRETSYMLVVEDGAAGTRDVVLQAGTWRIMLDARAYYDTPTGALSATQAATVQRTAGGTPQTVTATLNWNRTGSSGHGYLIHASDLAVGTIVVAATDTYTMSIAAMTLGGAVAKGSVLWVEKVS